MSRSKLQTNTIIGFVASIGLAIVKFAAGVYGLSSALIADAVESFADTIGSILVLQALRVADKPPDKNHPYGYGKAEALATVGVGLLLIVAASFIVWKAFHEILIPHAPPASWTLLVLLLVIAAKEILFRFVMKGADQFDSDAARADAWHHRADAITSVAALIGVSVAVYGPAWFKIERLVLADEVAAILASGIIYLTAFGLIGPATRELLDAVSHEMSEKVRAVSEQVEGVVEIEKVYVRKSGAGYHVDMHMHVDPDLSIQVAHNLSGKVKATLREAIPSLTSILIHVEPAIRKAVP